MTFNLDQLQFIDSLQFTNTTLDIILTVDELTACLLLTVIFVILADYSV